MSLLFTNAKIVATKNGEFEILKNAYLGVEGSKIDYIGTQRPHKTYDA